MQTLNGTTVERRLLLGLELRDHTDDLVQPSTLAGDLGLQACRQALAVRGPKTLQALPPIMPPRLEVAHPEGHQQNVGSGGQVFKHPPPYPVFGPAAEPSMGVLPATKALGQVAPRNSGAIAVEDGFDEPTIVLGGCTDISRLSRQQVLDPLNPYRVMGQPCIKPNSP